jgi:hypothetical protein
VARRRGRAPPDDRGCLWVGTRASSTLLLLLMLMLMLLLMTMMMMTSSDHVSYGR